MYSCITLSIMLIQYKLLHAKRSHSLSLSSERPKPTSFEVLRLIYIPLMTNISKLEFYFLGLPQPQKGPESLQNPEMHESEKVRSPFLERLGPNFTIFTRTTRAVTKKVPEL